MPRLLNRTVVTEKARRVIFFARYEAAQFGSPYIETEHLLLGLLRENAALVQAINLPITCEAARKDLEALRGKIAELPVPWNESHVFPGELPVYIHGRALGNSYIERRARDWRRFFWEKKEFRAPDIVLRRGDGAVSFDLRLADDRDKFQLVNGGWQE